jgi:hypothetical protein
MQYFLFQVPSIDDNEDLEFTHEAFRFVSPFLFYEEAFKCRRCIFRILCFSEEETFNVYKAIAAVMNMGELVSTLEAEGKLQEQFLFTFVKGLDFMHSRKWLKI